MSLLEEPSLNYLSTVEQFFLKLKGSGLSLSGNDYHLISAWEQEGLPLRDVCRAIERGMQRAQSQNRSVGQNVSLTYLKRFIEEELNGEIL